MANATKSPDTAKRARTAPTANRAETADTARLAELPSRVRRPKGSQGAKAPGSASLALEPLRSQGSGAVSRVADGSVRGRLLAAADQLFYEEGVHTVGIDRVIERAGVAKASLYSAFGSKDELIAAYLEARLEERRQQVLQAVAVQPHARAKILAVFDRLVSRVSEPTFRGCAFLRASAEGPPGDSKIRQIARKSRLWTRELFASLAAELGAAHPERLARQLLVLYEGGLQGATVEEDTAPAREARSMAEALLDAEGGEGQRARKATRSS